MISLLIAGAAIAALAGAAYLGAYFRTAQLRCRVDLLTEENKYLREDIKDMSRHWSQAEIDLIHARKALRDIVALKTPNMAHIGTRMTVIAEKALRDAG